MFVTSPPLGEMSESAGRNPRTAGDDVDLPGGGSSPFRVCWGIEPCMSTMNGAKGGGATSLICCSTGQLLG